MKIEIQKFASEEEHVPVRLSKLGKTVLWASGAGLVVAGGLGITQANSDPSFTGLHETTITSDDNSVTEIALDEVKGSENHIQATVDKIVEMNPGVFQGGDAYVESKDMGQKLEVPDSVNK